tara:strand:+ start:685 stop:960 length:276 start_codon:yes stop_codon:yes gene_type:complete
MAKTITDNRLKISRYLFDDDVELTVSEEYIRTPDFIIGDLNSTNSTLYENLTDAPEDWAGGKYKYSDNVWSLNPDWTSPEEIRRLMAENQF